MARTNRFLYFDLFQSLNSKHTSVNLYKYFYSYVCKRRGTEKREEMGKIYIMGKFHDQGDAKWIVMGHNDTPFGRPTPGRPIGRPEVGCSQNVIGVFSY